MSKEKEIAGASYIISFYQEVQLLTHNYGSYINLMLEISSKFGDNLTKMDDQSKDMLTQNVQLVRLGVMKTYIQYRSISSTAKLNKETVIKIEELYNVLKNSFVIDRNKLEEYVILLNNVLVEDIIQTLLVTGQDLVKDVYNT